MKCLIKDERRQAINLLFLSSITLLFVAGCSRDIAAKHVIAAHPVIQSLQVQGLPVSPGNTVTATVVAKSPQGLALTYLWKVSSNWVVSSGTTGSTATITAPNNYGINGTVTVTILDTAGSYVTGSMALSTEGGTSPVIRNILLNPSNPLLPQSINLLLPNSTFIVAVSAVDPDGYSLTYTWTISPGWTITGYGPTATVTAPPTYNTGGYITVTISDGHGFSSSATIAVSTQNYIPPQIVFVSARDGDYSIYSMKEDGSAVTRLSDPATDCVLNQCFDTYPTSCKNSIAFSSNRTGRFQIYTMTIDGQYLTQITNNQNADFDSPDLSNDCGEMVYTQAMGITRQLELMNITTGSVIQITNDDGSGACCGKYSPDDKTIAFIHDPFPGANPIPSSEAPMSIYTIAPDGSNRQWLCNTSNIVPPLSWSPDGKTIIFLAASPTTGHLQVFSMPADCSAPPKALSDPQFDAFDPAFSPDGNYIAYVSTQYGNERIFLLSTNGYTTSNIDITNDVHLNDQPAWQKGIPLPAP